MSILDAFFWCSLDSIINHSKEGFTTFNVAENRKNGIEKRSSPKIGPFFLNQERKKSKREKVFGQNLTRQPRPGPGYDVPPEPPSRRPWL